MKFVILHKNIKMESSKLQSNLVILVHGLQITRIQQVIRKPSKNVLFIAREIDYKSWRQFVLVIYYISEVSSWKQLR